MFCPFAFWDKKRWYCELGGDCITNCPHPTISRLFFECPRCGCPKKAKDTLCKYCRADKAKDGDWLRSDWRCNTEAVLPHLADPTAYEGFIMMGLRDNAVREYEDLTWIDEMLKKGQIQIEPAEEVELKGEEDDCKKSNGKSVQEIE